MYFTANGSIHTIYPTEIVKKQSLSNKCKL